MKKRFLAAMLCILMIVSLVPVSAFAYIGIPEQTGEAVRTGTETVDGKKMIYLENDYIHFSIDEATGTTSYTLPTAFKDEDYNRHGKQVVDFTIEYPGKKEKTISVESCTSEIKGKSIIMNYTFKDEHYETAGDSDLAYSVEYKLVNLDNGSIDKNENGAAWGVIAEGIFKYKGVGAQVFAKNGVNTMTDDYRGVIARCNTNYRGFPTMGHSSLGNQTPKYNDVLLDHFTIWTNQAREVISEGSAPTAVGQGFNRMNTTYFSQKSEGILQEYYYTEIFTDKYNYANPFIALSNFYRETPDFDFYSLNLTNRLGYSAGNKNSDCVVRAITQAIGIDYRGGSYGPVTNTISLLPKGYALNAGSSSNTHELPASRLWGYRNLPKANDAVKPTEADKVYIDIRADRLAVFKKSDGYTVEHADSEERLEALKAQYGADPVAVLRGSFTSVNGSDYTFDRKRVALSPSVTATWGDSGEFTIKKDGTITHSGLNLNAPTFKFYQPVNKPKGKDLTLSFTPDGIKADIDPTKNGAFVYVNIPYATTEIESATIAPNGDLVFDGNIRIGTLFDGAKLEMEQLGYGMKDKEFSINGVKASGRISTADLFNLELADIEGEINTFKGQEKYSFNLNLNVFDLFKTNAELELKENKKTGELLPNNLYFYVAARPGIPLVPPAVIGQLNGGGIGFYGLADTINGKSRIPAIKLRGTVTGTYLHLVEGTGDVTVGPSQLKLVGKDIKLVGVNGNIINEFGYDLRANWLTRQFKKTTYEGLYLSGSEYLTIIAPSERLNFIEAYSGIGANIFGGVNNVINPTELYLGISANGRASGKLKFPDGWAIVGGKVIAGATVDVILGGQTAFRINKRVTASDAAKDAFKNLDIYLGVAATGSFLGSGARVWVIIPDVAKKAEYKKNWGLQFKLFRSLGDWDWEGTRLAGRSSLNSLGTNSLEANGTIKTLEANNTTMATTPLLQNAPVLRSPILLGTQTSITLDEIKDEEQGYIVLVFDESVTEEQIKNNLKVASFDPKWLETDAKGDIINADTANAMTDLVYNNETDKNERLVILHMGGNEVSKQSFNVDTGSLTLKEKRTTKVQPLEKLEVSLNASTVNGEVKYPVADKKYVLRTYLAKEKGGDDYLIDEQEISNVANITVDIPKDGTLAPTGEYYVSTFLAEQIKGDFDDDPNTPEKEALIQIDNVNFDDLVNYTNVNQPDAPNSVAIAATGNEGMKAAWSQVDGASDYRITVYKEENGKWVDSGYGYELDASDNNKLPDGMSYDPAKKEYSFNMAITGDSKYYMDLSDGPDGQKKEVPVSGDEILAADKDYKIAVQAGKTVSSSKYYSVEKLSEKAFLPKYTPLEMKITLDGKPLTADENTHIYTGYVNKDRKTFAVSADTSNAKFEVKQADGNIIDPNVDSTYTLPAFEGTMMLEVTGSVSDSGITDTTKRHVLIYKDNIAPVISLDKSVYLADAKTGSYNVTGTTEPGAKVSYRVNNDGDSAATVQADMNGKFTISGTLSVADDETVKSNLLTISAADDIGNMSAPITASVISQVSYTITDGSGKTYNKSEAHPRFTATGEMEKCVDVMVGKEGENLVALVRDRDYTLASGSTIVTFTADYFKNLPPGKYNIRIVYDDGFADGTFEVAGGSGGDAASVPTPTITENLSETGSVNKGSSITLSITATSAEGKLTYQWYKNGTAISGATGNSYTISNAAAEDAGSYYCIVVNTLNGKTTTVQSNTIKLIVTDSVIPQVSYTITDGSGKTYNKSEAHPRFTATGEKEKCVDVMVGKEGEKLVALVRDRDYTLASGSTIVTFTADYFKNLTPGKYNIRIVYDDGFADGTFEVAGGSGGSGGGNSQGSQSGDAASVPTPTITENLSETGSVNKGSSITLSITATSADGKLTYQWYKNGTAISGATGNSYTISNAAAEDAGSYYCIVVNTLNGKTTTVQSNTIKLIVTEENVPNSGGNTSATTANVPKTEGDTQLILWLSLLLLSGCAAMVLESDSKRKKTQR